MPAPEPRIHSAADLHVGQREEFEREITSDDITAFAELSRDHNPLHVDADYAQHTNYGQRIVHGAFQVGLVSAMAGMYLPGRDVVVGSFQCRFPAPLYYPARVRVQGEIVTWVPQTRTGVMRVRVIEAAAAQLTAEVHVGFSLHEARDGEAVRGATVEAVAVDESKPVVLLTGASGGLGRHLAAVLRERYRVIGIGRTIPEARDHEWIAADVGGQDWETAVAGQLGGRPVYGIVHAAWPAGPQGGLLEVEDDAIRTQVEFGGVGIVRMARFLRTHAEGGGRLVILGTTAATLKPVLPMAAYSLGKAALEHTVRLLAPELARSQVTVNLVAPSFVATGMNSGKTSRVVLTETAKVPLGRLCEPEDVARAVEFLLSPAAGFVSGQMLPLTGGQI